ncbi:MAG: hypothetical protein QOJ16_828 [Acidobacteriota bacterium]|nr:hypothetical protein [Acidobacteriota bacterium]
MTRRYTLSHRIGFGWLFAFLLFAGLEQAARLMRPAARAAKAAAEAGDSFDYSPELGWRLRPGFHGPAFGAVRDLDENGFLAVDAVSRPDSRRRVLFLGDSLTFGNGVRTEESFAEVLGRRLPGTRVFNLGVPGYSSYQGRVALELYTPRLRPDVVVFSYGYNDRRYVLRPDEADGERAFRRLSRRAAWLHFAHSLALVDLLRGQPKESSVGPPDGVLPRPLDLGGVVARVGPEDLRRNLDAVARFCAARPITLIFLLFNDNRAQTAALERGVRDLRAGRFTLAEPELRAAVALGNSFSDAARLHLSRLYAATGRPREAAAAARSPRTFSSTAGGYPIFTNSEYREIILDVAAKRGVAVVDAGPVMDRHPEWYFDSSHFNPEAHRRVAELLAAELEGRSPQQAHTTAPPTAVDPAQPRETISGKASGIP